MTAVGVNFAAALGSAAGQLRVALRTSASLGCELSPRLLMPIVEVNLASQNSGLVSGSELDAMAN